MLVSFLSIFVVVCTLCAFLEWASCFKRALLFANSKNAELGLLSCAGIEPEHFQRVDWFLAPFVVTDALAHVRFLWGSIGTSTCEISLREHRCLRLHTQENRLEFTKVPGAVTKAKSYLYRQFLGILQSLWRVILKSLYVNMSPFQKQIKLQRKLCAGPKKELLQCCCNPAWTKSGALLPWNVTDICETFQTSYRTQNISWTAIRRTIQTTRNSFRINHKISSILAKDQSRLHQFVKKKVCLEFS